MFDLGWAELLLVAVVALIVVGPKDLPGALRTVTGLVRQARGMAREFQRGIEEIARDSGVQEIKRELLESVDIGLDKDLKEALDPDFDDKQKIASDAKSDPTTDGNSILNPETAKLASKPNAAPAADAEPDEMPKPDIKPAETSDETPDIAAQAPETGSRA